ncbi:MAG: hypothetical protein ACRD0M_00645 [Acidimicrobiales bacterium]
MAVGIGLVVFMVLGAVAAACTNLATLNLSSPTGRAGDTLTITGSSFRMPTGVDTGIVIRWNALDGAVLAEARPDRAGNFATTITVPQATPDTYVVLAVLKDARGNDTSGTPARASFQVLGGAGKPAPAAPPAPLPLSAGAESSSAAPLALLLGLGVVGLGLFGAGFAAFLRQARGREAGVAAPVRRD